MSGLPTNECWSDTDWAVVLHEESYASPPEWYEARPLGAAVEPVRREQITEVVAFHAESPEGYGSVDFAAVLRLDGGRWGACWAWADTTGWGCQDATYWRIGDSREQVEAAMDPEFRRMLAPPSPKGAVEGQPT